MNRRGFLTTFGAALAGATLDPEKLLWVPGKKLISIPAPHVHTVWSPPSWVYVTPDDFLREGGKRWNVLFELVGGRPS